MIKPGTFKVIRTHGTETTYDRKPTIPEIMRLIGCEGLDTVTVDRERKTIMLVDDTGMLDGKPINAKATELYHGVCVPETEHQIHGDVVLVNDGDFA